MVPSLSSIFVFIVFSTIELLAQRELPGYEICGKNQQHGCSVRCGSIGFPRAGPLTSTKSLMSDPGIPSPSSTISEYVFPIYSSDSSSRIESVIQIPCTTNPCETYRGTKMTLVLTGSFDGCEDALVESCCPSSPPSLSSISV